jgi:hypothetical protein
MSGGSTRARIIMSVLGSRDRRPQRQIPQRDDRPSGQVVVDRVKDFVAALVRVGRADPKVMRFAGMPALIRSQAVA